VFAAARLLVAGMLVWALVGRHHHVGYYAILRWVTCGVALYGTIVSAAAEKLWWAIAFGAIALLFNPILPAHIARRTWTMIDLGVALLLVISIAARVEHE
jgi:hypothetical protein